MATRPGQEPAPAPRAAREAVLADVRDALERHGERVCRWPACDRAALPVSNRGPDGSRTGTAAGQGRGRRPEFCSEAHQRLTTRRVRELAVLLDRTRQVRETAPVREHKALDAVLAEIEHRLALHGEPASAPPPAPRPVLAPAPPRAQPAVGGAVLAVRADPGGLEADEGRFADTWEWFRDAVDGTRRHTDRQRGATEAVRKAVVAAGWLDYVDLADAADELARAVRRVGAGHRASG